MTTPFANQITQALVNGGSLKELAEVSPFLFECTVDHFARWEDIPLARQKSPRAIAFRRQLAFSLGMRDLRKPL